MKKSFVSRLGDVTALTFVVLYILAPLGWVYWLWLSVKVGGFLMFALTLFPLSAPIASMLGIWSFLFGVPVWVT
ncbi:hypothetical protein ACQU0X_02700 [Pseudovibrio ascidiaceicola]|uniref:hypothetical protein n=1 Tax=Pseudovibrio ascidiaceicola TaxID=285279 RepID=UPI003D363F31